ncbi:MAG: subfamily B ATP-binding cassette protein MsbA [Gammaproteobacteria bacterium]|jgi:subfamily B ATP-binding cassette protein MsbA
MIHLFLASPKDIQLYRRLIGYIYPYRMLFVLSFSAMLILALSDAAKAAILKPLLDGAFINNDPDLMISIPLYLVLLFIISGFAIFISGSSLHYLANRIVMDMKEQMFDRLLKLPSSYYDEYSTGNIVSKFTYDVEQIKDATTTAISVLVKDTLVISGLFIWMLYLDLTMTIITLLSGPFILMIAFFIRKRLRVMSSKVQVTMADINRTVNETIGAHRIIKLFSGQQDEKEKFHKVINLNRRFTMKFVNASLVSGPAVQLIASIALAVIIYYATGQALLGTLSVGTFVSFFAALVMMLDALKRLVKVNEYIQKGLAASESVFGLLDEPMEQDIGRNSPLIINGEITIQNLGFSYNKDAEVLSDISLSIKSGETIALVGSSGSGKTTLSNLIPRFYQYSEGNIKIDGIEISEMPLSALRDAIGMVAQDIILFNDTIRNNIAYGLLKNSTDKEVEDAAIAAHAVEFIKKLPQGMDTMIGENGLRLSGGQRQRIALARSLLKKAPILILDEATSALDSESERHIQLALDELRHNHTCIIIAHRLTTIESADRIVVLDHGRIVETGKHAEMIDKKGPYSKLYASSLTSLS